MKILMSAYAIRPHTGSEPGIGWNWAVQASRFNDVWVLTPEVNGRYIEPEMQVHPNPRLHFAYHRRPRGPIPWRLGNRQAYHLWQWTALKPAQRLHREVGFDLAQHITFGGVRFPTLLARLGVPYILGPVGGIERGPRSFYPSFGLTGAAFEAVRDITAGSLAVNPWVRLSLRNASHILVTSRQTLQALPRWAQERASVMSALGVTAGQEALPVRPEEPFSVLYAGRLLPWKGVSFAIEAFARFQQHVKTARFTIAGAGPDRPRLQRIAAKAGVSESVHFTGNLPFDELAGLYRTHHVFIFPCFHLSGMAVLEAMNEGLPILTLDLGDAAESVTPETGIRVPARNPGQVVRDLAAGLESLNADRQLLGRMSAAARLRVAEVYDWDRKGEVMRSLYETVAGGSVAS